MCSKCELFPLTYFRYCPQNWRKDLYIGKSNILFLSYSWGLFSFQFSTFLRSQLIKDSTNSFLAETVLWNIVFETSISAKITLIVKYELRKWKMCLPNTVNLRLKKPWTTKKRRKNRFIKIWVKYIAYIILKWHFSYTVLSVLQYKSINSSEKRRTHSHGAVFLF